MKRLTLLLLILPSCNVNPTVHRGPNGLLTATSGLSLFSKAASESGEITLPDGTRMAYTRVGKDETAGVTSVVNSYNLLRGTLGLSKDAVRSLKTTEGTKRVINNNATAVKINESNNKLTRDTFVAPEVTTPAP